MNKIIVVDDDLMTRTLIKRYLHKLGFDVLLEESGDNLMRLVLEQQPVACIIDLVMEGKEGVQTIFELESLPNKPKIIAISSNPNYLNFMNGLDIALLLKPVTLESLQKTLEILGIEVIHTGS
jgi:DNA-binding response OmpR family regulator